MEIVANVISIHVPLAGHDDHPAAQRRIRAISIHVPLAGHDRALVVRYLRAGVISIHVPLDGAGRPL